MRHLPAVALLPLLTACAKEREPAPTEMVDLVRFVFQHWEEPELLPEAMDNLKVWLDANIDAEESESGFRLEPLTAADVSTVARPDRPLTELLGAAGGARSAFGLLDHAGHIVLADQTFSNPSQYKVYERRITDGNRARFVDGSDLVRTDNDIETSTLGVSIPYLLHKDYRWVVGESSEAILARSWIEDRSCNDGGGSCLEQSFSIDLWMGAPQGCLRWTASWSEITSPVQLGDDTLIASLALGLQNVFRATEEFLQEQP